MWMCVVLTYATLLDSIALWAAGLPQAHENVCVSFCVRAREAATVKDWVAWPNPLIIAVGACALYVRCCIDLQPFTHLLFVNDLRTHMQYFQCVLHLYIAWRVLYFSAFHYCLCWWSHFVEILWCLSPPKYWQTFWGDGPRLPSCHEYSCCFASASTLFLLTLKI